MRNGFADQDIQSSYNLTRQTGGESKNYIKSILIKRKFQTVFQEDDYLALIS
jgi:hypothetical protein